MESNSKLILIDGSSFMYRAFFAVKQKFTAKDGTPTGAVFILTKMLKNLIQEYQSDKIIAIFDAKGPSFRNEMYSEYKANRPPMPQELIVQVEYINNIVKAMGLPVVSISGVEADDVIGSYAKLAESKGYQVIICTGDKDLAQLVNDKIILRDTMKEITYDSKMVVEKYGVPPELIIDLLALKGDSVDNIPGMKGVGDVTAKLLLNELGGIYSIKDKLDQASKLKFRGSASFAKKFTEQWDLIELSYKLATIKCDVQLPLTIEKITAPKEDTASLLNIYDRLNFFSLANEIKKKQNNPTLSDTIEAQDNLTNTSKKDNLAKLKTDAPLLFEIESKEDDSIDDFISKTESTYTTEEDINKYKQYFKTVLTKDDLQELTIALSKCEYFALDTETNSLNPIEAKIVGMSFCSSPENAFYIPINHSYLGAPTQLSIEEIKLALDPIFLNENIKKIGHNLKFDRLVLFFNGIEIKGILADTFVMGHILDSTQSVSLDNLAFKYLNYNSIKYEDILDSKKETIDTIDISKVSDYACEDAHMTLRLYQKMLEQFTDFKEAPSLLDKDMQVLNVLYNMERTGAYVDGTKLKEISENLKVRVLQEQKDIFALAGEEFNISSPKQLANILFVKLAIPYPKANSKTKTVNYSTSEEILSEIADQYDIAKKVLHYRMLTKLISTYTDKLPLLISKKTGRVHTNFNIAGTITGRLSSSDPNLQNIPARTAEGRDIRKAFCAPKGYKILSADYSQIELRLIAHHSQDPALIKAFNNHQDIHRSTAAEVLGKPIDQVTDAERSHAKATNFGLMYGMGAKGLSKQTGKSFKEAKEYINIYFERYPNIKGYMNSVIEKAKNDGYVTTITGSRIYVNGIFTTGFSQKSAERTAINAPMQGGAAEIIKLAMIEIQKYIDTLPADDVKITLQVHDELVFEVKESLVEEFGTKVKNIMENVIKLSVPLEVGIGVGDNWNEAH